MSHVPPSSNNFGFPAPPGIPSYPGTPAINSMPGLKYGPSFDGRNNHGLTPNPYSNSLFEDVNAFQDAIFNQNGLGYPPFGPGGPVPGVGNGPAPADPSGGGHGTTQPNLNQHA